ncbi:transcription termination factor MTERF8, chloroplastic-like [Populus alba]|uniref:transcription termination factor MTERF8, chloroplastic-like n=1 Tax=Populus alba TaxID=43335 RepID=UPI00158C8E01|nr:transcription termination factor MTERF8, chloroplastic-like [Populus alba]
MAMKLFLIRKRFLATQSTSSSLSPSSSSSSSSSFTVDFLVNSCGLPLKSALLASRKLKLDKKNLRNPPFVLQFLKSHNFDETHISKLIEKRPEVLQSRVEGNLTPKFDFLVANGFVGKLLHDLIIHHTEIFKRALDSRIKPAFSLLKSILHSNENVVVALKRSSRLLSADLNVNAQPNIDFLRKEGVPADMVAKLIILNPGTILSKRDRMVYAMNAIKNLGLEPNNTMFVRALIVRLQMTETTWNKKIEVMKSLQWSEEEILGAFKRYPQILAMSEEKIRSAMDFYINTMELQRQIIIACPIFLGYSIDKRIRPRYNVIKVLESKELIKGDMKISTMLNTSEKTFLINYVSRYVEEVPGLLELYKGTAMRAENEA